MRETTEKLYSDIRKKHEKLMNVKELGVRLYTDEYIYAKLAKDFYKSAKTIENIVCYRV